MKEPNTQIEECIKAMQRQQQRSIFSPTDLIAKHSCGIFTALSSHVNTTSEREDSELCWNSTSTYQQSSGGPREAVSQRTGKRRKSEKCLPRGC